MYPITIIRLSGKKQERKPFLFIFNGESNSGGYALNSQAPIDELGVRDSVEILNNTSLEFETLNIGVNNLIGHTGFPSPATLIHGWELGIANKAESTTKYNNSNIIKTGQGGSKIAQWNVGGTYFDTFESRLDAAKELIDFSSKNIVVLFSLGINDAIAGTNITTWKAGVIAHLQALRDEIGYGNVPIVMTEFQGMGVGGDAYDSYNTAIQEIAESETNVFSVSAEGVSLRDLNHWDYFGMKTLTERMLLKIP